MNNAVAKLEKADFSNDELSLIKDTICKGANDTELKLFLHQCKATGLNPLARQIYSVERNEYRDGGWRKARSIQVSIDGFRLIAERSGHYAGQVGPFWCGPDGEWKDVWVHNEYPIASRVGVLRDDFKEPCWGVARLESYVQKTKEGKATRMWSTMPDVMIAKCAEALALRKAFPQELSGLYTADEMQQADNGPDMKAYEVDTTKPASPFKTAIMRNKFQSDLEGQLRASITVDELNNIIQYNKEKLDAMRASGDERDEMSITSIQNAYKLMLVRLKEAIPNIAPKDDPADFDGSDIVDEAEQNRFNAAIGD